MSITKETQRAELHKTIWRIANDLRGSVDGWDFKSYVLGMLFYRFISENLTSYLNEAERAVGDANLNETLERVFTNIEGSAKGNDSEDDLKGLFDYLDVNSSKLGPMVAMRNEKIVKLFDVIGELSLRTFSDNTIDTFGDAYEFPMQMYAASAGKSSGEYHTPQEVSVLLARIAVVGKKKVNKVYDPAAGYGSLLLKFAKISGKDTSLTASMAKKAT